MTPELRPALLGDLEQILAIKRALSLGHVDQPRGGFLLGASPEGYRWLIERARVRVLAAPRPHDLIGFAVALDDPLLRASDLWARKAHIDWIPGFDVDQIAAAPVAYFDQIAVIPGTRARYYGAALGLSLLAELLLAGHSNILATTVIAPIVNRAALAYLARVGARHVGQIHEIYPELGPLISAVHHISSADLLDRLALALHKPTPALTPLLELALPPPLRSGIRALITAKEAPP